MIHPSAIIGGEVVIGERVTIEPYAVIGGKTIIHDDAYIGCHAVIGAPAQSHGVWPAPGTTEEDAAFGVIIERGACVRELVQVHAGTRMDTRVGAESLLMAGAHIAHDSQIGTRVTMGSFSLLGGFTQIDDRATFGQGVVTHPWTIIGESAMVGLNSSVIRDVLPFQKVAGSPARIIGWNSYRNPELVGDYDAAELPECVWDAWSRLVDLRDSLRKGSA